MVGLYFAPPTHANAQRLFRLPSRFKLLAEQGAPALAKAAG
jgi:hypothetical protein